MSGLTAAKTWPYFCFWIVYYGAAVHISYAVLIAISADAGGSTPVAGIVRGLSQVGLGSRIALAIVLILASLMAMSVTVLGRQRGVWTILALLPQQALFVMSSYSSVKAMVNGMYADGASRPFAFIASDQITTIIGFVVYSVAIVTFHAWTARWRR